MEGHDEAKDSDRLREKDIEEQVIAPAINGVEVVKKRHQGWRSRITLEPVMGCSMMAIFLAQTSFHNLYLETACLVDLNHTEEICTNLYTMKEAYRDIEIASQKVISDFNVLRGFIAGLLSLIILIFLGPWSDCSGRRRPLMLLALGGMAVASFNILVILSFKRVSAAWVLYAIQIPMAVGGNFSMLMTAAFSYMGDVCKASDRSALSVMGSNRAVIQACSMLGAIVGPIMFRYTGFYGVFIVVFSLQMFCIVYVAVYVRDVSVNRENAVSVLDVRLPYEAALCLLRRRDGSRRAIVIIMLGITLIDRTVLTADQLLLYMYFRNRLGWTDVIFGFYSAYKKFSQFIGTLFLLKIMKSKLKMSNGLIGAVSGISLFLYMFGLVLSPTTWSAIAVTLVGFLSQGGIVVQKPIVNEQIEATEQGKIYSIMGAADKVMMLSAGPAYAALYAGTVSSAPAAFLLGGAACGLAQIACFLATWHLLRKRDAPQA